MTLFKKVRKRRTLQAALPSLAAAAFSTPEANAALRPKVPGETKVVALFGTTGTNNGIGHEIRIRRIFESKKDWRLIFIRADKFFTPGLIKDTDLLMICRDGSAPPIDLFTPDSGVADSLVPGSSVWTEENVSAIIDNVRNRGMGLLALHNTIRSGNRLFTDFLDVTDIKKYEFEPLWIRRLNHNHPITKGIGKFLIQHDEQYAVIIKSASTVTLFETTAIHEKRQAISGWALERGSGRIAGLLPGSTIHAYQVTEYQTIIWRAAHWVMNRSIPPYSDANNTLYD
ncbi:ThuA domain-containing protein [Candidatus Omnitrophota bacterium]